MKQTRLVVVLVSLLVIATDLSAQVQVQIDGPAIRGIRGFRGRIGPAPAANGEKAEEADGAFSDGPTLKTDPEAQQLLARAEQFVQEGRFDLATVLWQKVLDDSSDNLVSVDGRVYISLRRQVEARLAELPKPALQTYRVTADGEAQAVLSKFGTDKEEEALSEIVRRFFLSSFGDDAAYKLGCLALDRHDFVGASRMFSKVLEEYPNPTIPKAELALRQAVAAARVGDKDTAKKFLNEIESATGPRPSRTLVSLVTDDIENTASLGNSGSLDNLCSPALSPQLTSKTLTSSWTYEFPLMFPEMTNQQAMYGFQGGRQPGRKTQVSREQLIDRWRSSGWISAGKLAFAEGRVFFKTNDILLGFRTPGGEKEDWGSAWKNAYEVDEFSQMLSIIAMNYGMQRPAQTENRPRSPAEIFLFGDRIQQDYSIAHGLVLNLEGRRIAKVGEEEHQPVRQPKQFNWNSTPRRTRSNWLAAYDVKTAKVRWYRPADDDAKDNAQGGSMGFMAAPVACGNLLLAPVTDGGTMWLYGISPEDGRTLWKTYLCDEPLGGASPWSPVSVTVEGREAYVLCGCGVIFALDGTSGGLRWVVRYDRDELRPGQSQRNPYGGAARVKDFNGWSEEKVLPYGKALIVMPSDSDWVFAIDRRTCELLWKSPRTLLPGGTGSYLIGVQGRSLFIGGRDTVRRVDIPSGKVKWTRDVDSSYGRGLLTEDAVYIPVNDSVLKLGLEKGEELAQVGVALTSNDPVGNLFTDGEKLWVLSANRVYSLTNLEERMSVLEKKIGEGNAAALLDRIRLYSRSAEWDKAAADLLQLNTLVRSQKDADAAASTVFAIIDELKLAAQKPNFTLALFPKMFGENKDSLKPEIRNKLDSLMAASLASLPRAKQPGVAINILAIAPLIKQEYLISTAARVTKNVSTADDKETLAKAVTSGSEPANMIAAEAWAIQEPERARDALKSWLGSGNAKVKFVAARALMQAGDTSAVGELVNLLSDSDLQVRLRSIQTLRAATAQNITFTAYAPDAERAKQAADWKTWFDANRSSITLKLPLPEAGALLNRTLVCCQSRNQVVEFDATGKEVHRQTFPQVWAALGLPNGNRLIACTTQPKIVEYDDQWKEVWSCEGLPAGVWSVERTADGTTLVTCPDALQIIEITASKEKKVIWRGDGTARPTCARRLDNGNTLICLQNTNKVVEIDATGKQVREIPNIVNPFCAQKLDNGNVLIAAMMNGNNGFVAEYDGEGRQVKVYKDNLRQVYHAQKLDNGNLIYTDVKGVYEIDPDGKQVWAHSQTGVTGFSRF